MTIKYPNSVVHELIQKIYLAGANSQRWPDFLESLRAHVDGGNAVVSFIDREMPHTSVDASVGIPPAGLALYRDKYVAIDPFVQLAAARAPLRPGFIGLYQELISDDELEKTAYYREFGKNYGCIGGLICVVYAEGPLVSIVGVSRKPGRLFGPAEVELFETLIPHFRTAMRIHRELMREMQLGRAAVATLNRVRVAAFICDQEARVLHMNDAAKSQGSKVDVVGRLDAATPAETKRLRTAIAASARACETSANREIHVNLTLPSHELVNAVIVGVQNTDSVSLTRPMVAVLVPTPADVSNVASQAAKVYGLTPAESRVAEKLIAGDSVRDVAQALAITYENARTHVKRILAKTGTRRQSELVHRLLTSVIS